MENRRKKNQLHKFCLLFSFPQIQHMKSVFGFRFVSFCAYSWFMNRFWYERRKGRNVVASPTRKKTRQKPLNERWVHNEKKTAVNGTSLQWWLTCLSKSLIYVIFLSDFWSWIKKIHTNLCFFLSNHSSLASSIWHVRRCIFLHLIGNPIEKQYFTETIQQAA